MLLLLVLGGVFSHVNTLKAAIQQAVWALTSVVPCAGGCFPVGTGQRKQQAGRWEVEWRQRVVQESNPSHLLSGLYFIHTSSVALPAAGLRPASKGFGSELPMGGGRLAFQYSTTFHKTLHLTLTDWFTIETGSRHL